MKLCINCAHHIYGNMCGRQRGAPSLVDGVHPVKPLRCDVERAPHFGRRVWSWLIRHKLCGKQGQYWQYQQNVTGSNNTFYCYYTHE